MGNERCRRKPAHCHGASRICDRIAYFRLSERPRPRISPYSILLVRLRCRHVYAADGVHQSIAGSAGAALSDGNVTGRRIRSGAEAGGDLVSRAARRSDGDHYRGAHDRFRQSLFGQGNGHGLLQLVLIVAGLASIAGSFIVKRFVPLGPYPPAPGEFDPRAIPRLLRRRAVRLANFGYLGHMWGLYAMWTWIGLYISYSMAAGGQSSASSWPSLLAFIIIASGFVGAWLGGVLADRIGRERVVLASLAVSGAMAAAIGFVYGNATWLLAVIGVVWGISIIADSAQFSAILTERVEAQFVGTALTLQLALGFALTAVIIMALPLFAELIGWKFAFWMLVPGPIIGIWSTYRLLKISRSA